MSEKDPPRSECSDSDSSSFGNLSIQSDPEPTSESVKATTSSGKSAPAIGRTVSAGASLVSGHSSSSKTANNNGVDSIPEVARAATISGSYPPLPGSKKSMTSPAGGSRVGINGGAIEIESVTIPSDGVKTLEDDGQHPHTVFTLEVRFVNGLRWVLIKRYSDFREVHDKLKKTNACVKNFHFPKKHLFRSKHHSIIEQRRIELERYLSEILNVKPLLRVPIFNFLEVYAHLESFERKRLRRKKLEEMERMKKLLPEHELTLFSEAFQRLVSTSGGSSHHGGHNNSSTSPVSSSPSSVGADNNNCSVSKTVFRRDILGIFPEMPTAFAMRCMKAMSSDKSRNEVTLNEFLRFVAILKRGSLEDQLQLAFSMCDLDHVGKLSNSGLNNLFLNLYGRGFVEKTMHRSMLNEFFDCGRMRLTFDEFSDVIQEYPHKKVAMKVVTWMPTFVNILVEKADQKLLDLQEESNPVMQQRILSQETRWESHDIKLFQEAFLELYVQHEHGLVPGNDEVDLNSLNDLFHLQMSNERLVILFSSFGKRANGSEIDIFSFVHALDRACRGSPKEQANLVFITFAEVHINKPCNDEEKAVQEEGEEIPVTTKFMSRDNLFSLLQYELASHSSIISSKIREFIREEEQKNNTVEDEVSILSSTQIGLYTDHIMSTFGSEFFNLNLFPNNSKLKNRSPSSSSVEKVQFLLSENQFIEYFVTVNNLSCKAVDKIQQATFTTLGLRPINREEERKIALLNFKLFPISCASPVPPTTPDYENADESNFWYLVDLKWFSDWCAYMGTTPQMLQPFLDLKKSCSTNTATTTIAVTTAGSNTSTNLQHTPLPPPPAVNDTERTSVNSPPKTETDILQTTNNKSPFMKLTEMTTSFTERAKILVSSSASNNPNPNPDSVALTNGPSSSKKKEPVSRPKYITNMTLVQQRTSGSNSSSTSSNKGHALASEDDIQLGVHYVVLCEPLWQKLQQWYGGGPEIKKKIIRIPTSNSSVCHYYLDVYNRKRQLQQSTTSSSTISASAMVLSGPSGLGSIPENTGSIGFFNFGKKKEAEMAAIAPSKSSNSDEHEDPNAQTPLAPRRKIHGGGSVGLVNLGNTCYMNSSLQCLGNTSLLADYFLSGMYLDDINRTSTLGLQGKLAESYGKLNDDFWPSNSSSTSSPTKASSNTENVRHANHSLSPYNFKKILGKFNETFRNNDQQDSQEFLAFLLSGLSEDLNRIKEKPYIEQPDSDGRIDNELADEWWRNHLRREVSVIVALFTGQYKSLITCSQCNFQSARFEPFTFLQVPLPEPTHHNITLLLRLAGTTNGLYHSYLKKPVGKSSDLKKELHLPFKISLRLPIAATVLDLKLQIVAFLQQNFPRVFPEEEAQLLNANDIKIAEFDGPLILGFKSDHRRLAQIRSIDRLIAFQLVPTETSIAQSIQPSSTSNKTGSGNKKNSFDEAEESEECKFGLGSLVEVLLKNLNHEYPSTVPGVVISIDKEKQYYGIELRSGELEPFVPFKYVRTRKPRLLYTPVLSRKLYYATNYLLNPFRPVPFALPDIIRFCPERTTGLELYTEIYERVKRYIKEEGCDLPLSPPCDWQCLSSSNAIDELACTSINELFSFPSSSPNTNWFVLRRVEHKGIGDTRSLWLKRSLGHTIPCTNEYVDLLEEENLAIDWSAEVLKVAIDLEEMKRVAPHQSTTEMDALDKGSVPLSHCLDSFSTVEKIDEGYCSCCAAHREMTKKLDIWRLPPVMVIHLKRFQYSQTYRRKLGSLVEFPMYNLDLEQCVAPHEENPKPYPVICPDKKIKDGDKPLIDVNLGVEKELLSASPTNKTPASVEEIGEKDEGKKEGKKEGKEEGQEEENLEKEPHIINRVRRGYTDTNLEGGRCLHTKYNLYGVVNHLGALGGGHYTAYARNAVDDQWYSYDDDRVRIIEESKVVTPAAYLLFYIRSDMKNVNIEDVYPRNTQEDITDEDIDRFVEEGDERKCVLM